VPHRPLPTQVRVPYTELIETYSKEFFSKPRLSKANAIDSLESIVKSDHRNKTKIEKMKMKMNKMKIEIKKA
jgi:hypothetical protein